MTAVDVIRTVPTELPFDELWAMVGDAAQWSGWMVDRADLVVEPGASGTVHDRGASRTVQVGNVGDGRLTFTWWPVGDDHRASTVELAVLPTAVGSTLHITERFTARASAESASAGIAWDVRTLLLVLAFCAVAMA